MTKVTQESQGEVKNSWGALDKDANLDLGGGFTRFFFGSAVLGQNDRSFDELFFLDGSDGLKSPTSKHLHPTYTKNYVVAT